MTTKEKIANTLETIENAQKYINEQLKKIEKIESTDDRRFKYIELFGYTRGTITSIKINLQSI